jgi:hypothetical protein
MPFLLPTQTEQRELSRKNESSVVGGTVFLTVLVLSIAWVVGQSVEVLVNAK